jgi:hypothetical protein
MKDKKSIISYNTASAKRWYFKVSVMEGQILVVATKKDYSTTIVKAFLDEKESIDFMMYLEGVRK